MPSWSPPQGPPTGPYGAAPPSYPPGPYASAQLSPAPPWAGPSAGPPPGASGWAGGPPGPPPWWVPPRPQWRREEYAGWGRRVAGALIDGVPGLIASMVLVLAYLPLFVGLLRGDLDARPRWGLLVVGVVLYLAALGWQVVNRWVRAGRTGQTAGKKAMGTWLVSARDGRPVGVLNAFLRDLLHAIDGVAYVGYLWPLWDEQRQTLADKVIDTVVVRTPVAPLTQAELPRP